MTITPFRVGSRRAVILAAVGGLHVAAFQLAASGLLPRLIELPPKPPAIHVIFREPAPPVPVRPAAFELAEPYAQPVDRPILDIPEFEPSIEGETRIRDAELPEDAGPIGAAVHEELPPSVRTKSGRVAALIDACYPAASRRLGEEGRVLVRVRIGADGKAVEWRVTQSSGFARLDQAVVCVLPPLDFVPARKGGRAVAAEAILPVVFELR